jgi:hypothetical protein
MTDYQAEETASREVDDMEDLIDDQLTRRRSGRDIAQALYSRGFGRRDGAARSHPECQELTTEWQVKVDGEWQRNLEAGALYLHEAHGSEVRFRSVGEWNSL